MKIPSTPIITVPVTLYEYPRIFVLGQKLIELIPIYIYPRYFIYTSFFIFPRQEDMIHRLISIDMQGICIFQDLVASGDNSQFRLCDF